VAAIRAGRPTADGAVRFGVLGPLLVHDGHDVVEIVAPRQRVLLAALVTHAGRPVSSDELVELVWDGRPPAGAADTLRAHVMRLRRVLGLRAAARIVTRYPGYLIDAGQDEVDLLLFERLSQSGAAAIRSGAWADGHRCLTEALDLWRGRPLVDVPSDVLRYRETPRLDQLRLQVLEWRVDAALHLGRHAEVVAEVQALAAEHPMREHFHAQLMLALYGSGRQAEALEAYRRCHQLLADELATAPGPELRELQRRILATDPALTPPSPPLPSPTAGPGLAVPRELPCPVAQFVGRGAELAELVSRLSDPGPDRQQATPILAISGMAGVGKTALAVRLGHQVAGLYPDGQLYANLRGYDAGRAVSPAEALAGFLRSLRLARQDVPARTEERAARFRSVLAGRRVLVLLDNASNAEHVRHLLPGTPGSAAIITSRDALGGLVARDGAVRLDLDVLPMPDAVSLLRLLIGAPAEDAEAVAALARQCSRLPLALRLAAELVLGRPSRSVRGLVSELGDNRRRLELLDRSGDKRTAVSEVLSWSYRRLNGPAARAFRLIGLHPGADLDAGTLAALTGDSIERSERVLCQLDRAFLTFPTASGQHSMHDLVRAYAQNLAACDPVDPVGPVSQGRHAGFTRQADTEARERANRP
jgi:DNA-binding SARP family transcriptional activator